MEMIKVKNIVKKYKDVNALNDVSLTINEGELYGLLGVNGAGKTTLIKILSGLSKCDSGEAYINRLSLNEIDKIKEIIDVSPQETSVAMNLTVKENLLFFQKLYDKEDEDYLNHIIS